MSNWTSVKERLPEVDEHGNSKLVLVAVERINYTYTKLPDGLNEMHSEVDGYEILGTASWCEKEPERYWSNSDLPDPLTRITHWHDLIDPPRSEEA